MLDGGWGTLIQGYRLGEADFRGERFKDWPVDLKGNTDLLNLTRPDIVREIHSRYVEAGADITSTNTFTATRIAQADYQLQDYARQRRGQVKQHEVPARTGAAHGDVPERQAQ